MDNAQKMITKNFPRAENRLIVGMKNNLVRNVRFTPDLRYMNAVFYLMNV